MGHLGHTKQLYKKLIQKLDSYPIGIIEDEKVYKLMQTLYTPEEANIISRMPLKPSNKDVLSKATGIASQELEQKLKSMALKGIVLSVDVRGQSLYAPMWSIPGFIEMTLMKMRDDIPQKELAVLMSEMLKDRRFAEEVFRGETQFGRALVDDKAAEDTSDILPYEVATEVVKKAKKAAVVLCYCRHKQEHNGNACKYPMDVCMALNVGAEFMIHQGYGREIDNKEALDILQKTSEMGLMHIGDNVKHNIGFICNCCECCCCILGSYHQHGIFNVAVASNYIMTVEEEKCVGCGRCASKCQMKAISLEPSSKESTESRESKKSKESNHKKAQIDAEVCLGCGICYRFCGKKALHLQKREKKIFTPESGMEKLLTMAIERGKLQDLIFDDVYSKTHAALRNLTRPILQRKSVKQYLLRDNVRKKIVNFLLKGASKKGLEDII